NRARLFLEDRARCRNVTIITGSIRHGPAASDGPRPYDIVFVGRLAPIKQPEQILQVTARLAESRGDIKAVLVGDGPLRGELAEQVRRMGLAGRVELLGKRKDVKAVLDRSKVFLLTSRSEGLSIAMAEAMAAGVVPVVADIGELRDLVRDSASGFLVAPGDIDGYAERIGRLLADEQLWRRCSAEAARTAASRCHIDVISRRWAEAIGRTVRRAGGQDTKDRQADDRQAAGRQTGDSGDRDTTQENPSADEHER
ncbi:MAG: glycosyltransferase, partial [Planctomycetes bacterium]|nr:glycosyltransferase [Planctomycetota bacterium]